MHAVNYFGVANLFTFMKTISPYGKPYLDQLNEMESDPEKDSMPMAESSPGLDPEKEG